MTLPDALTYRKAEPFPHCVTRAPFSDDMLRAAAREFPAKDSEYWKRLGHENVAHKLACGSRKVMGPTCREIVDTLNGPEFVAQLAEMAGIKGLIADPKLHGGGMHMILPGGRLEIHADFNWHKKLRAIRRLNLLLFLNASWSTNWGGDLELWARDRSACVVSVPPRLGTMVVFNTDDDSYHGHPHPLACPETRARKSIALYYYQPAKKPENRHGTIYIERPAA